MAIDQYRFWTEWSEEDGEWVGLRDGFPLVSWLKPDREAADAGIRTLVAEAIEYRTAEGKPLSEPRRGVAASECWLQRVKRRIDGSSA